MTAILLLAAALATQPKPNPLALTDAEKIRLLEDANRTLSLRVSICQATTMFEKSTGKDHEKALDSLMQLREQVGAASQRQTETFEGIRKAHNCPNCGLNQDYVLVKPK